MDGHERPVTAGLTREQSAEAFKKAWKTAKEAGRTRPTAKDILDARKALGFPPSLQPGRGVGTLAPSDLSLVGTTTKGFRISTGTEVVRLRGGGSCSNNHVWEHGSTVYTRDSKPMCPICGSVIE